VLHLVDVAKGFGKKTLFQNASLHISQGDRIGLVGPNGSGKTTIFRLITGEASPDTGEVTTRKGLRIGYLAQEVAPGREGRLLRTVTDGVRGLGALRREREVLLAELHDRREHGADDEATHALAARLAALDERFEHAGGYEVEGEARAVLAGLGFGADDLERPLGTFSGGWQVRAELARLLLDRPDLLLLDEPTNHLDLESMQWFESYLAQFGGAFVVVSHDREFLNRVVSKIVEVRPDGMKAFPGDYDTYRRMKADEIVLAEKRFKEQQARIREIQDFIDRNRVRKDRASQVQSRMKMLAGIERLEAPRAEGGIAFRFPSPPRSGRIVLTLEGLVQRYGANTVFDGLELTLYQGERIAMVGPNGAGKSTLLKVLAGRLAPTDGRRTLGTNVTIDYYAQHQLEALETRNTVLGEISRIADVATGPMLRGVLGAFRFSGEDVDKTVGVLSGGEKARLALAKMLLRPANLLLMDEPTNHLDITSREVLEEALRQYDGTLVITSHDRRFIDAVATKVIEVHPGARGVITYPGNYSEYVWKKAREGATAAPPTGSAAAAATDATPRQRDLERERKRREAEQRAKVSRLLAPLRERLAKVESAVEKGEARQQQLTARLADPTLYLDAEAARAAAAEHDTVARRLKELYAHWEEVQLQLEEAEAALAAASGQGESEGEGEGDAAAAEGTGA
jgi:ATP-binding cassette subfamily F protein 3